MEIKSIYHNNVRGLVINWYKHVHLDCYTHLYVGNATRYCDRNGEWLEPDVGECQSSDFVDILDQVMDPC